MVRASLALALLLAFTIVGFGWRSAIHARRYGDSGVRIDPRGPERVVGPMLVISFTLMGAAPVFALTGGSARHPAGVTALVTSGPWAFGAALTGTLLATGAGVLTVLAQVQMGESWRIGVEAGERTELVTGGLFAHVRNPIFTGMLAFAVGLALLVPSAVAIAGACLAVLTIQAQVRLVEEPNLRTVHGAAYLGWASRTGRFLPILGRLRPIPAT